MILSKDVSSVSQRQERSLAYLRVPLIAFALSRLMLAIVGYVAEVAFPSRSGEGYWNLDDVIFLDIWARWDSSYYLSIVREGYFLILGEKSTVAFFPLYPLLVDWLSSLVSNPILAGILVSNISLLLALIFLYKLSELEFDSKTAKRTVFYLVAFPTSFFFSAVYTESSFLLFSVAAMYFARTQRWGLAGLMGMFCSATRIVGVIMWGIIGLEWLRYHGWTLDKLHRKQTWQNLLAAIKNDWPSLLSFSITPLGLLSYMLFLHLHFNDPLAFWTVQSAWGRENLGVFAIVFRDLSGLFQQEISAGQGDIWWQVLFDSTALFAAVIIGSLAWKRLGASYGLLVLISVLIPASSSTQSMLRYVLVLFPLFMMLGHWGKHEGLDRALSMCFTLLLGLFFALFVNWYFIA